jgi:hypothetical protein
MQKRVIFSVFGVVAAATFLGFTRLHGQETQEAYVFSRGAQQGKAISPVPLNLSGKHPLLVYLGSYIVNAHGSCNSCHTCPSYRGTNPYNGLLPTDPTPVNAANFLSGGTPFVNGSITSPNLTPDSSGKPGGLSYAQFKAAMHDGTSAHSAGHILQVMPWPIYRNMDENDMRAVYAYLSAIPSAPSGAGQCTGPDQTH